MKYTAEIAFGRYSHEDKMRIMREIMRSASIGYEDVAVLCDEVFSPKGMVGLRKKLDELAGQHDQTDK